MMRPVSQVAGKTCPFLKFVFQYAFKKSLSSEGVLVTVINKVIIAWLFGYRGRNFRDLDVFQVEEAELHLHVEESVHV